MTKSRKEGIWLRFWIRLGPVCALAIVSFCVMTNSIAHPSQLHWRTLLVVGVCLAGLLLSWALYGKFNQWLEDEIKKTRGVK